MGFVTLDDNFSNHPKVVSARAQDRTAIDLFVCGLCYCRKYHTDGFVPEAAIIALGVKSPAKAVNALVSARLWDPAEGGFSVHDYASWYPSDEAQKVTRDDIREKKRAAGRLGGIATWAARSASKVDADAAADAEAKSEHAAEPSAKRVLKPSRGVGGGVGGASVFNGRSETVRCDLLFEQLIAAYPEHRRTRSAMGMHAFVAALNVPNSAEVFSSMLNNLQTQITGEQWAEKRMVPRLDKWLMDGLWQQVHEPARQRLTSRNQTTVGAAARILGEKA